MKHRDRAATFLLTLVGLAPVLTAQGATAVEAPVRTAARAWLQELTGKEGFPGTSVAWVLPDGTVGALAAGRALDATPALTPKDRLLSGSIGKTYVAAVVLQLVADGRLEIDERIAPRFEAHDWFVRLPNAKTLTLRSLLNHTSGIPEHVQTREFATALTDAPDRTWTPRELLAFVFDSEPLFAVGEGWSYADTNYVLIGALLEELCGEPWYDLLRDRVLTPLELTDTVPSDRRVVPGLVPGFSNGALLGTEPGSVFDADGRYVVNPQFEYCGGGLACTPTDLARWCHAWATGGAFPEDLLPAVRDGVPARTGRGDSYGLGAQILESPHGPCVGHSGFMPGYLSIMGHYPEFGLSVAVQHDSDDVRAMGRRPRTTLHELAGVVIRSARLERR